MSKKECIAMLLAGGQGSRLGALTSNVAKPAVSFGGKFRIIDFALSNCANSGIVRSFCWIMEMTRLCSRNGRPLSWTK